jgi:uncharacterized protein YggL (DUF469 family)
MDTQLGGSRMSTLNRKQLKKLILQEFKMIGMASPDSAMLGHSPYQDMDHGHDMMPDHGFAGDDMGHHGGHKGALSMEDCCKAVLCLIECCDCEITKQKIRQCCEEILGSC